MYVFKESVEKKTHIDMRLIHEERCCVPMLIVDITRSLTKREIHNVSKNIMVAF